jgi:hypothetical protein
MVWRLGDAFSAALIARGQQRPRMSEIAQPRSSEHSKQGHRRPGFVVSLVSAASDRLAE